MGCAQMTSGGLRRLPSSTRAAFHPSGMAGRGHGQASSTSTAHTPTCTREQMHEQGAEGLLIRVAHALSRCSAGVDTAWWS